MATVAAQTRPLGALGRMGLVAAIHAAVLLGIMRSMGIGTAPAAPPDDVQIEVYKEVRPIEDPPLPLPDIPVNRDSVVLPEVPIDTLQYEPQDVITGPVAPDYVEQPPTGSAVAQPELVGVRPDPHHPLSKPEYSPRMIREGNQGTIEVEVYVLPNGRVADARVVRSTGFEELDLAAMAEAKRNWRLLPASRDGVPIAQWHRLRVTFKLNDR